MATPSFALTGAPPPRQLLFEMPFWLTVLACALIPGSVAPWIDWNGLPLRAIELGIAATAGLYLAVCIPRRLSGASAAAWTPVLPFLAAAGYAALGLFWTELESDHASAMAVTLAFGVAAAALAASLLDALPAAAIEGFLWRLTVALAAISALYAAESILSLGLRSEANRSLFTDFGMDRVRGPLYGAATGYVALLPALGFAVERALSRRGWGARLAVAGFLLAILGMGSRAGVMLAALYLLMLFVSRQRLRRKAAMIAVFATLGALAAALVFSRASMDRLRSFNDSGRELTHRMAANYLREQPRASLLAGAGYGAVWSWYFRDAQKGELVAAGDNLTWTPFGPALYHSHSTALEMAVELGLPGLGAFCWQLAAIGGIVFASRRAGQWISLSNAVAVASLGFFFDLFLFKNTTVNLIWWLYAAAASRLTKELDRGNPCV